MMFYPNDIYEDSLPDKAYDSHEYRIYLFGSLFDKKGSSYQNCVLRINGIRPFFDIRVPLDDKKMDDAKYIQLQIDKTRGEIQRICEHNNHDLMREESKLGRDEHGHARHSIEHIHGKGIEKYQDDAEYIRLTFLGHAKRKKFIQLFHNKPYNYQTAYDDTTCYHRIVARNAGISFSNLLVIDDQKMDMEKIDKYIDANTFAIIEKYGKTNPTILDAPIMVQCDFGAIASYSGDIIKDPVLRHDHSLVASWDIETVDSRAGVVPLPQYEESSIISIATLFAEAWSDVYSKSSKFKEAKPGNPKYNYVKLPGYKRMQIISIFKIPKKLQSPNREYVFVNDEKEMILTWARTMHEMNPHIWIDFNGTEYDITWLVARAKKYNIYDQVIKYLSKLRLDNISEINPQKISMERYYQEYKVKIAAGKDTKGKALIIPGLIYADLAVILRVLHCDPPYYSLNYFLTKKYGKGGKVDMDHKLMHELANYAMKLRECGFYRLDSDVDRHIILRSMLGEVHATAFENAMAYCFEYNMIDSVKTFDLFKLAAVLIDKREMGSISYTSLNDCFMRANGMKVRNKILALSHKRGFHISNIPAQVVENEKYAGAFVFFPKRGLRKPKLTFRQYLAKWCKLEHAATTNLDVFHKIIETYGITIATFPSEIIDDLVEKAAIAVESPFMFKRIDRFRKCIENKRSIHSEDTAEDELKILQNLPFNTCSDAMFPYYMTFAFLMWLTCRNFYPIAALDANSLYPAIIQTLNLSPEMIIYDPKVARDLIMAGEDLEPLSYTYANRRMNIWFKRHKVFDPDGDIERQRKIDAGADPKKTPAQPMDYTDSKYNFGMYPTILKELGILRNKVKKELSAYKDEKELIESKTPEEFEKLRDRYTEVCLIFNYLDAKQRAIKVYMNTFYGECGNKHSALRRIPIAMAITTNGQDRIKNVKNETENKFGYEVIYGDTDSNYSEIVRADQVREHDIAYYTEKISVTKYAEHLVLRAMKNIEELKKHIDKLMLERNGNPFLKFGYEEVLYPCAFFIKKKYGGVAHTKLFNAHPKELFLRGTENSSTKRDPPKFMKDILDGTMNRMFNLSDTSTISEIVDDEIKKVYTNAVNFEHYIKGDEFRPLKQNVRVQNFVKRMKGILADWYINNPNVSVAPPEISRPPNPGERFKYVIVEKKPEFDSRGRLCSKSISFKMEYPEVAKSKGYKIDLSYYMSKNVLAQLAMIMMYKFDKFGTIPTNESEDAINKVARQYIASIYQQYSPDVISVTPIYREITKVIAQCLEFTMNTTNSRSTTVAKILPVITCYDLLMLDIEQEKKTSEMPTTLTNQTVEKLKKIRGADRSMTRDDLYTALMTRIDKCAMVGISQEVKYLIAKPRKSAKNPHPSSAISSEMIGSRLQTLRTLDCYQTANLSPQIGKLCTSLFEMIKRKNVWFREITKHIDVNVSQTEAKNIKIIAPTLARKINSTEIIKYLRSHLSMLNFQDLVQLFIHVNQLMLTRRKLKIYEKAYQDSMKLTKDALSAVEIGEELAKI